MEIIAAGAEPLRELIGAMHSKLLLAELARQRGRVGAERRDRPSPLSTGARGEDPR